MSIPPRRSPDGPGQYWYQEAGWPRQRAQVLVDSEGALQARFDDPDEGPATIPVQDLPGEFDGPIA